MPSNRVNEHFQTARYHIDRAVEACRASENVPPQLEQQIQQLDRQSQQVQQMIQQAQDEQGVLQTIDELEETSDRALQACQRSNGLDQQLQAAVAQAHETLSELKHQLH